MLFVETGGKTEIGELDVATTVEKDVVGFDITERGISMKMASKARAEAYR